MCICHISSNWGENFLRECTTVPKYQRAGFKPSDKPKTSSSQYHSNKNFLVALSSLPLLYSNSKHSKLATKTIPQFPTVSQITVFTLSENPFNLFFLFIRCSRPYWNTPLMTILACNDQPFSGFPWFAVTAPYVCMPLLLASSTLHF